MRECALLMTAGDNSTPTGRVFWPTQGFLFESPPPIKNVGLACRFDGVCLGDGLAAAVDHAEDAAKAGRPESPAAGDPVSAMLAAWGASCWPERHALGDLQDIVQSRPACIGFHRIEPGRSICVSQGTLNQGNGLGWKRVAHLKKPAIQILLALRADQPFEFLGRRSINIAISAP